MIFRETQLRPSLFGKIILDQLERIRGELFEIRYLDGGQDYPGLIHLTAALAVAEMALQVVDQAVAKDEEIREAFCKSLQCLTGFEGSISNNEVTRAMDLESLRRRFSDWFKHMTPADHAKKDGKRTRSVWSAGTDAAAETSAPAAPARRRRKGKTR